MTLVNCGLTDCVYNEKYSCKLDSIAIGEEFFAGCSEYDSVLNGKDYGELYYKLIKMPDGSLVKGESHGKKIEYNGYVFYTEQDIRGIDYFRVTEERTGMSCGLFNRLKEPTLWKKFVESEKDIKNVADLPLARYVNGEWKLVEGKEGAE